MQPGFSALCLIFVVHDRRRSRDGLLKPLPQQLGEKAVVAIPPSLVVQGHDEKVGALEVFQCLLPGCAQAGERAQIPLHEGITERTAEPIQNGST